MESRQDELRRDLDAAVQTRKELGKEYESEIVDSFLSRLDARLDAQVDARVERRLAEHGAGHPGRSGGRGPGASAAGRASWRHMFTLVMAVPLSGVAAGTSGLMGLLVCWAGIVGVSASSAIAERVQGEREAARARRGEWD
ncbi:hypothetical protein ACWGB8_35760 [Kitasatospora sp. NPDC054939]